MALDDDIRVLSGIGLFRGLTEDHLRLLAFGAEKLRLGPGETLYHEGEPAMSAYIVVSGRIDVMHDREGEPVKVSEASAGDILGELAIIAPTRRMSSAVAVVETRLMSIERRAFRRFLEEYPEIAARLHGRLSQHFRDMIQRLESVLPPDE